MFYVRGKNPQKKKNVQKNLGFFSFLFYGVWRLADIKHKYIIYMHLYEHMIFFLSKTVQNGKENYINDLLIALWM